MVSENKKYLFILLAILILSFSLKLYYAQKYATYTDEVLSSITAEGIAHSGTPRLPSGAFYHRNPLFHYILAIPVGLFGIDYLSMRIPSILFSLLTILAIFMFGVRIANKRVALAAAFLISFSTPINQIALSGRMYMVYTFFFTLTLYFFYRGFIESHSLSKKLCLISMAVSLLSFEGGAIIWPILLFLLFLYHKFRGARDPMVILGCLIWILLTYFVLFYKIPGSYDPFTVRSDLFPGNFISIHYSPRKFFRILTLSWRNLDAYIPFSIPFFLGMTIFLAKRKELKRHFPLLALISFLVILPLFNFREQNRLVMTLVPLYVLTICQLLSSLLQWINFRQLSKNLQTKLLYPKSKLFLIISAVIILLLAGIISYKHIPVFSRHISSYVEAFGYIDSRYNPQPTYDFIKKHASEKDIIIQTTLDYGYFFLGESQNHYYLRQRVTLDKLGNLYFTTFEQGKDPYYGRPIIDSKSKLLELIQSSSNKIWVVLGPKTKQMVDPEVKKFIEDNFDLVFDDWKRNRSQLYSTKVSSS